MKRREFIQISLVTLLLAPACKNTNGRIKLNQENQNVFPVLEVEGTYHEIGYQCGSHFKKEFNAAIDGQPKLKEQLIRILDSTKGTLYAEKLRKLTAEKYPHLIEEINGMAKGSGIDRDLLWAMSIKSELGAYEKEIPGCSTVFYKDNDNQWLIHNEDGDEAYKQGMFILKAKAPSGVTYTTLVYPSLIPGVGPSVNDKGVIQTTNFIGTTKPLEGIPRYFVGRAVLEAGSLDEAVKIATQEGRAFPWHHNLASWTEKKYFSIETLPEGTIDTRAPNSLYIHTNHTTGATTKDYEFQDGNYKNSSSVSRYEVLTKRLYDPYYNGRLSIKSPDDILAVLASHENKPYSPCRHPEGDITGRTLGTALFDLNTGNIRFYKGNPCTSVKSGAYNKIEI